MPVFHSEDAERLLASIDHELGLDRDLLTSEGLECTFERLRSTMLPGHSTPFLPSSMAVAFLASCFRFADRPAYRIDGEWITWAECAARIGRLANQLLGALPQQAGPNRTPVVAALLYNSPLRLELFYAAALGNFALLPVNHRLTAVETDDVLANGAAELLVTSAHFLPKRGSLTWCRSNGGHYLTLWFPSQIVGGIAVGLLLVGLSGAAVAHLPPARFGVGGAVNNAVRQLGGVFGTALAVVLVGQTGAGLEAFRFAFLCLGLIGLAVTVLCLPLPRQSGRIAPLTAG